MARFQVAIVSLFFLGVSFWAGVKTGQGWNHAKEEAKAAHIEAQVRYLMSLAYPKNVDPIAESVPPSSVMKDVEQHKASPEVVRAILYDEVSKEQNDFRESSNKENLPVGHPYWEKIFMPTFKAYGHRIGALREWKPGESGPTTPK